MPNRQLAPRRSISTIRPLPVMITVTAACRPGTYADSFD
jgi:hypothetical protein